MPESNKGLFISFEGTEGAGKSTQVRLLAERFEREGREVLCTREPGGTDIGDQISNMVKYYKGEEGISDVAELLLFAASRAQLVEKKLKPFLAKGGVVICDRYSDSTVAYQGYGRELNRSTIDSLVSLATAGLMPDLTILMDLTIAEGMKRVGKRGEAAEGEDRIELAGLSFHERVRSGFLAVAQDNPERVKIVAANDSIENIHQEISKYVDLTRV